MTALQLQNGACLLHSVTKIIAQYFPFAFSCGKWRWASSKGMNFLYCKQQEKQFCRREGANQPRKAKLLSLFALPDKPYCFEPNGRPLTPQRIFLKQQRSNFCFQISPQPGSSPVTTSSTGHLCPTSKPSSVICPLNSHQELSRLDFTTNIHALTMLWHGSCHYC